MLNACSCSSVCLLCSLVRRHGSLTKDVSSIITGRPCPPAESAAKSGDVDTQSETDAVNVRHEDYGTTGTTSLQASQHRKHASRLCASLNMYTHFLNSHFLDFLVNLIQPVTSLAYLSIYCDCMQPLQSIQNLSCRPTVTLSYHVKTCHVSGTDHFCHRIMLNPV